MRRSPAKLLAVTIAALGTVFAGTAAADPPVVPGPDDIVVVGSQTTGSLLGQLSTDYNAYLAGIGDTTSPRLHSFDSTGPSPITPRVGASAIARPATGGDGLIALNLPGSAVDVDRMDLPRQPSTPATDTFVLMAKDAVSWAAKSGGNAPANLTTAQLKSIYECTVTNWTQLNPSFPNATIKPYLPQTSSTTRAFFLAAIGVTTPGACVTSGPGENQGVDPVLNDVNVLVPYSVGHYLGQTVGGHSTPTDGAGPLTVRAVNGVAAINTTTNTINAPFAASAFGRVVYNVVRQADWTSTGTKGTALRGIFGPSGWICTSITARNDIKSYGFLQLPGAACGATA
ncbi:substrate-binding domain-containing protein [Kitasatospora sp. NPDC058218]|uniref:substrate-binding domain-containing protein n=1 Tax=Kitasatospora sp. NPDC058218 TaxID=3346385 RepID=UPI0036DC5578